MPKGYVIARIDVTDPERYARYTAVTPALAARHGGRFIVRGGRFEAKEGTARARNAVIEFPDYASALAFYDDPGLPRRAAPCPRGVRARADHRRGRGGSLMPAYWIAHVEVTDEARYGEYARRATAPITAHGGRFLARGGEHRQLEGNDRARNVVIEFPDLAAAEACYNSPAYREALTFARDSSVRDVVIVEGVA